MSIDVQLRGADKLEKTLKRIGKKGKSIVRSGTRAGSMEFKKAAASNLPSKHAHKLGGPTIVKDRSPYTTAYWIGTSKEHWQLVFLEFGIPGHWIEPADLLTGGSSAAGGLTKRRTALKGKSYGHPVSKPVWHPGVRATRWLSRSMYGNGVGRAIGKFQKVVWKRIVKETK